MVKKVGTHVHRSAGRVVRAPVAERFAAGLVGSLELQEETRPSRQWRPFQWKAGFVGKKHGNKSKDAKLPAVAS